ncbi:hypothetical protein MMU07_19855 [Aquiflexum sp. LQ15W]|uniref:hypothetical protein n=1 Tax=Cognataquiflexum nitidum TaxID=2922272 RepID=UPI001F12B721|nr:hypothetical protein [Cognataquiflexum nitidum]MCH6201843.1 hypothetical protein [Cognataquiflexum nitidum]
MIHSKEIKELLSISHRESSTLLVCVLDLEGEVAHCNPVFRKFFRLSEAQKPYFLEFFDEFQKTEIEPLISDLIGKPNDIVRYTQSYFNSLVSWEFSFLKNSDGDFLGILGIGTLKHETEQLSNEIGIKVNIETDIYIQVNNDWEVQFANLEAENFFEKCSDSLRDKKIWQVFPDPKIYEYALHFKKAKESGNITVIDDFISENGKWYQIIICPRSSCIDIYFKDVSEVQLIQSGSRRLDSTLETILHNSDQGYVLMSQDLRIMRFNEMASKQVQVYLGKALKEGDKFLHFLLPGMEGKFLANLEDIIGGKNVSFEQSVKSIGTDEGRIYRHDFYPVTSPDKKIIGFVYSTKDIHDSHDVLTKLLNQNNVLKEILYSQSVVLRSPLSSILGLLELLDKKQLDRENQKYLSYLKVLAYDLDQIIRKNTKTINE